MLRLSDLVAPRKRFNNLSSNTSKQNLLILSCLSDFMTCRERFYVQSFETL